MRATKSSIVRLKENGKVTLCCTYSLVCSMMLISLFFGATVGAQKTPKTSLGIAWQVKGSWHVDDQDNPVSTGEAIRPGSLLHPEQGGGSNSIVILIPDGQRILYECFLPEDCARDFRVPSLYRSPDPFAVDMLVRIHTVLIRKEWGPISDGRKETRLPRDETLVMLGPEKRVQISGLVAALPNGSYTYDLRSLNHAYPPQSHLTFEKSSSSITFALPGSGLYDLTIFDHLNTPRIDLFIAAAVPGKAPGFARLYNDAKALMADWNSDYQGWPIHDFQRAYLESLILEIKPMTTGSHTVAAVKTRHINGSAEPKFAPKPGVFKGDTAVTLECSTPGSIIHFTVDGSQPLSSSPVYSAPIMVKGTELTVKAFATAPGKKDSPVITGIFRIGD